MFKSISPGGVNTEIVRDSIPVEKLEELKKNMGELTMLQPEDIADAVYYILSTPPHVQVDIYHVVNITLLVLFNEVSI